MVPTDRPRSFVSVLFKIRTKRNFGESPFISTLHVTDFIGYSVGVIFYELWPIGYKRIQEITLQILAGEILSHTKGETTRVEYDEFIPMLV